MVFKKNGVLCQTEYLKGTAVAGVWCRVLGGYCRLLEVVMADGPPILSYKGVPPFLELFLKMFYESLL
jgi:hypothetical protein